MNEQQFRRWLDAYAQAFIGQNGRAAAALFAYDATYQWGPFGDLLRGPEAIRRKWGESMDPRAEERFEYEVLAVTDEIGIARWIASSHLPSHPDVTHYDGIFAVRLGADTLCTEFREWWNSQRRAETPPDGPG
jgi:SnoaL-like protein